MDPISAFALAGTVVTFVDFGSKLISGATELYKTTSGSLSANQELELVASDLRSVLAKISISNAVPTKGAAASDSFSDADFEKHFAEMCESAKGLAKELLDRLDALKVGKDKKGARRVWDSLSQAINSAWSQPELAALGSKLNNLRQILDSHVIFQLRKNMSILNVKVFEGFIKLDRQTECIIAALTQTNRTTTKDEVSEQVKTLTSLLARLETRSSQEHRKTRETIAALVGAREINSSLDVLESPVWNENKIRREISNRILDDLNFETRTHRFEELTEAYQKTFEWIFDESIDSQKWSNFSKWLSEGEGLYWIQGKAGAGKSTLMGFIHEDVRTRKCLEKWALKSFPLYIASFFFWLSGTREQKSQSGLLRSLLFDILNQEPDLVPVVFPHVWSETYNRHISMSGIVANTWSLRALKDAFRLLVHQSIIPMKLCLFVDGLDEFDGDPEGISELFKGIASPNVKVCLSSRPWIVFQECFENLPSLRLQDLTRVDIELYVEDLLSGNVLFQKHALLHPIETEDFVQEIVERADGVFLWVTIVVKSLLKGIRNRDSIEDIQTRLRRLPRELEPLYGHLLDLIDREYLPWASKAFQLLVRTQQHEYSRFLSRQSDSVHENILTLLDLTFAIDNSFTLVDLQTHRTQFTTFQGSILETKCEDTKVHLTARCAGLLETWEVGHYLPRSQVQFLHRTARDYLLMPTVWARFVSITPPGNFNPDVDLLRAYVFQLSFPPAFKECFDDSKTAFEALSFAYSAESGPIKPPTEILEFLYHLMQFPRIHRGDPAGIDKVTTLTRYNGLPDVESMLPVAAMFGLTSYLQCKSMEARTQLMGDGASLLHYAIPRDLTESRYVVPPTTKTI